MRRVAPPPIADDVDGLLGLRDALDWFADREEARVPLEDEGGEVVTCGLVDERGESVTVADAREAVHDALLGAVSVDTPWSVLRRIDGAEDAVVGSEEFAAVTREEASRRRLMAAQVERALADGMPEAETPRGSIRAAAARCTPVERMDGFELREFAQLYVPAVRAAEGHNPDDVDGPWCGLTDLYDRLVARACELVRGGGTASYHEDSAAASALYDAAMALSEATGEHD